LFIFLFLQKYTTDFKFHKTILLPTYHMALGPKRHATQQLEVLQCSNRSVVRRL
jgi:hypothetical protein